MDPKKIKGVYTVRADVSAIVNGYTFTNNNRNAILTASSDFILNFNCTEIQNPIYNKVSFISNNKLHIKAARIVTNGAPGLQSSINYRAANFWLIGRATEDATSQALKPIFFGIDFFNEWQQLDIEYLPEKVNDNYYLSIDKDYSRLTIDDYNLQSEYEGETFKAFLELVIDTAGILSQNGGVV